jgi:hypothetical protein
MPGTECFSYSDDVPLGIKDRNRTLGDLPRRPVVPCFSFPADVPLGIRNRDRALSDPPRGRK